MTRETSKGHGGADARSRVPDDVIERVLGEIDIEALIAEDLEPVRSSGGEVVAPCPFHRARRNAMSLSIDSERGTFGCEVCNFRGTALGWLMFHAGLSFPQALHELARRAGIDVERWVPQSEIEASNDARMRRLEGVAEHWQDALRRDANVSRYLIVKRGIDAEALERFGVGWAGDAEPDGRLVSGQRSLWQDGVLIRRRDGSYSQRFFGRVMFPIRNVDGRVIGFGGRVRDRDGVPKYLNSPGSPWFEKGRILYGLHEARLADPALARLVIVEGYLDVIALAARGVTNVVATLGTSITRAHLEEAFSHVRHVTLCLDGDRAGRDATMKALRESLAVLEDDAVLNAVFLPKGQDPDEFVRKLGAAALVERIEGAIGVDRALHDVMAANIRPGDIGALARLCKEARPLVRSTLSRALKARLAGLFERTIGLRYIDWDEA